MGYAGRKRFKETIFPCNDMLLIVLNRIVLDDAYLIFGVER